MRNKIIAVGTSTQNNKFVNGQSMMFQLIIDSFVNKNIEVIVVDYGLSVDKDYTNKRVSGEFSIIKLIDNFVLTFYFFLVLLQNPKTNVYINTAQSKVGFLRNVIFIYTAKIFKRRVVGHQFGANYEKFYNSQSPFWKKIIKKTIDKTDIFIVEGDLTKNQMTFVNDYQNHIVSIPNGLPEKINFEKIKEKEISKTEPIKLLYLSNLIESKGFWDVLEAVNILKNKYLINVKVIFAGKFLGDIDDTITDNPESAKKIFFQKIQKYNLQNVVDYYEGLYGEEKSQAFLQSHFFLLPSYYCNEGQPVSVLEAIAYGCVPIVTNYRLIPLMVNKENGFFVNRQSPDEIVKVILWSIENNEQYQVKSSNGMTFFKDNFDSEKYTEKIWRTINTSSR